MSGPVSERPAGTVKVLDFIVRVGEPVTRADIRKRFTHTAPRLLQEILTWLLESGDITVETDVDRELDTFTRARAKGGRRPTLSPHQKTFREELDELLDQQETWTRQEIAAALPHRPLSYIDPCLSVEKKAKRLVVVEIDGHNAYCRPETASKYDTNTPSGDGGSQAAATDLASPAGDTALAESSPATEVPAEEGISAVIREEPVTAPAGAKLKTAGDHALTAKADNQQPGIEPVDFIIANGLPFLEGAIIESIAKHRERGGVGDLESAQRLLVKLLDVERDKASGVWRGVM